MSRIGRLPVEIPAGVEVTVAENNVVTVKGPKGTLTESLPVEMDIKVENNQVVVTRPNDLKKMKSLHGLTRSLIANMITGVSEGYEKKLEINGVGYRAQKKGKMAVLPIENLSMMRETKIVYKKDFTHMDILQEITRVYHETARSYQ